MQKILMEHEIENLDLTKVAALQQKRTLAFVNHFVVTTAQFLNTFAKQCESKLMQFEEKLEKVDAAMVLLEARLSSIPEVNDSSQTNESVKSLDNSQVKTEEAEVDNQTQGIKNTEEKAPETEASTTNDSIQTKPEYERFIKMIQVGVPLEAVKLKVSLEGLDPKVLESLLKK
ncbi:unnamed protein product [Parnassius apollo]|uniref:(apollo) hypothetical protein n=1 Tax=Parnassius apollo TaxID=110799 RepID=A0A8S3W154_PARAO|nr:unnamed protein product [Parnassius apollo]